MLYESEVIERAKNRCEYCFLPADQASSPHQIDHLIPVKGVSKSMLDILCLCCAKCYRLRAGRYNFTDPESGELVRVFNPRLDDWNEHFRLADGRLDGLTAMGRATAQLLQFNSVDQIRERQVLVERHLYP
jgi:hypothetical protein